MGVVHRRKVGTQGVLKQKGWEPLVYFVTEQNRFKLHQLNGKRCTTAIYSTATHSQRRLYHMVQVIYAQKASTSHNRVYLEHAAEVDFN